MDKNEKRLEFIAGLREFADFIEKHPELPTPWGTPIFTGFLSGDGQKEQLAAIAKQFAPVKKNFGTFHVGVVILISKIQFTVYASRDHVCRKVQKVKMVEEQIIAAKPAQEEVVIPAHEETFEEWECEPLLSDDEPAVDPNHEQALADQGGESDVPF